MSFFGTGESAMSRADVVKRMWEYIKKNDLQVPGPIKILTFPCIRMVVGAMNFSSSCDRWVYSFIFLVEHF